MSQAPPLRRPSAILFDMDGVLVDSYEAWFHAVRGAAKGFGLPDVARERFASIWGQGIAADLRNLYPGRTHAEVEAAYEREMGAQAATIRVNPEARSTLLALRERGIPRALVTNTQVGLAHAVLRAGGLDDVLDSVQGMRAGVREKPHPDLLLAALDALGVRPADALMIGDSRYDEGGAAAARVPYLHYDMQRGTSLLATVLARIPVA